MSGITGISEEELDLNGIAELFQESSNPKFDPQEEDRIKKVEQASEVLKNLPPPPQGISLEATVLPTHQDASPTAETDAFPIQIRRLVELFLVQLGKFSEKNDRQLQELRKKHETAADKVADLTEKGAKNRWYSALTSLGGMLLHFIPNSPDDRSMIKFASEQFVPQIFGLSQASNEASQRKTSAEEQFALTKYQGISNKGQEQTGTKDAAQRIFEAALQAMAAVRG